MRSLVEFISRAVCETMEGRYASSRRVGVGLDETRLAMYRRLRCRAANRLTDGWMLVSA